MVHTRREKGATYPQLAASGRRKVVVVVAIETGGRWSDQAVEVVRQLASSKAREVPSTSAAKLALAGSAVGRNSARRGVTRALNFRSSFAGLLAQDNVRQVDQLLRVTL